MKKIFTIIFFLLGTHVYSQSLEERQKIVNTYDKDFVLQTKNELQDFIKKRNNRIEKFLINHPEIKRTKKNNFQIQKLHDVINGEPIYISTSNIIAQIGTRTDYLQPNGDLGLNLEGDQMKIAYWEVGGKPLDTHQEFQSNNTNRIIYSDKSTDTTLHATHVAGTLIASGVRTDAKGMAPKAELKAFNQSDDLIEAEKQAVENGLLISNHSYGIPASNALNNPWIMGAYSTEAKRWDEIANNAPYYLAVFSAGNSGLTDYEESIKKGYDKLTSAANAKNNLVVANVSGIDIDQNGDVKFASEEINESSSQGPSDDGRIKPDIAGMGTQILSSSIVTNSTYAKLTGTSMSAPNVAGSLLLLQELYNKEYGNYMKASTLKALALNTASRANFIGDQPDAIFGWGLLDARKAARTVLNKNLSKAIIKEDVLNEQELKTFQITASGNEDIKIMISWNDPAGAPLEDDLNNPTPALVNDLDLRVDDGTSDPPLPWKLDLNDVSLPAKQGDNTVDNVEQILIESPASGSVYDINISHKSNLVNQKQNYSLVVTGITSTSLSNIDFSPKDITIWPNPVKNNLNISSSEINFSKDLQASIYDMTGHKVMDLSNFNSTSNFSINVSSLSVGVYILSLEDNGKSIQKKIIKK